MSHARFQIRVYGGGYMVYEWNGAAWFLLGYRETYWGARLHVWRLSRRPALSGDVVWEG